ncbi:MAG: leucine-rich repeat protein [Prevotella sp.]|nr:leucine-rich repeat protein [Prevotella sp.]
MKKYLFIILLALLPMVSNAYDFMVNGVAYKILSLSDLECEVTDGFVADNEGKLVIPSTVEYKGRVFKVLGIGDISIGATEHNSITELVLEEGLSYIGSYAFWGQRIETIRIPKTITSIKTSAFLENKGHKIFVTGTWVSEPPINLIIEDGDELLSYNVENPFFDPPFTCCRFTYLYLGRSVNNQFFSTTITSVEKIVIGDQVKELTTEMLGGYTLSKLKTLVIGKGLEMVPYMQEGDNIEEIFVRTEQPQMSLGFNDATFVMATLYVPRGSKEAYMNADVWNKFWTIEEYDLQTIIPGDANGDGKVNVTDVVEIVNDILGNPSAKFNKDAADVNGDGQVNVTDIVEVVNIILSTDAHAVLTSPILKEYVQK